MAGRYLVTGVQLGILSSSINIIKKDPSKTIELIKLINDTLYEIKDNQFIGNSGNEISKDVTHLKEREYV